MKRVLLVGAASALLAFGVQSRADAAVITTLHFCEGATCVDVSGGTSVSLAGPLILGDYLISRASGATFESSAFSNSQTTSANVQRTGGGAGIPPLDIWLSASGYLNPTGNVFSLSETTNNSKSGSDGVTGLISYQTYFSPTNALGYPPAGSFADALLQCTPSAAVGSTSCMQTAANVTIVAGQPFSIVTRSTFNLGSVSNTQFGTDSQASVFPVPEPGSMMLLGTGLFGLASAARRRFGRS